jgi:hypothetical protein
MEINLGKIYDEDYIGECQYQTNLILDGVKKFSDKEHNYLIVPMSVYNILQFSLLFKPVPYDVAGLMHVGYILDFHVYLDMYMPPNEILISYDKSISRDNKLDVLLNNENVIKEKRVKIT